MGVYDSPPRTPQDVLDFLKDCLEERMDRENDDFESMPRWYPEDEVVTMDTDFIGAGPDGSFGLGAILGPFRDEEGHIWSFSIARDGVRRID